MAERPPFVDQTILYEPGGTVRGNCTEAAVASLLGLPLDAVPDFRANSLQPYLFWSAFRRFVRSQGFEPMMLPGDHMPDVLYLASGRSPRGVSHMVVMREGRLIHDPHPSRAGIERVDQVWVLLPKDPATTPRPDPLIDAERVAAARPLGIEQREEGGCRDA